MGNLAYQFNEWDREGHKHNWKHDQLQFPKALSHLREMMEQEFLLINLKLNWIMSKQTQLEEALTTIDAATTEIGNDLEALRDEVKDQVSQESLDKLTASASRLKAMGQDPANPDPGSTGTTGGDTTGDTSGDSSGSSSDTTDTETKTTE